MNDGINTSVGINYVKIIGGKIDDQYRVAEACNAHTEPVLRNLFIDSGMPLKDGVNIIRCTPEDLIGRYDLKEGIDMVVFTEDGSRHTLQQKTLHTRFSTCTFEETKIQLVEGNYVSLKGAWYYCTAQFYYVVYTHETQEELRNALRNNKFNASIREAALFNLPKVHEHSNNGKINWVFKDNSKYRYNSFRYFNIEDAPEDCLLARYVDEVKKEYDAEHLQFVKGLNEIEEEMKPKTLREDREAYAMQNGGDQMSLFF